MGKKTITTITTITTTKEQGYVENAPLLNSP